MDAPDPAWRGAGSLWAFFDDRRKILWILLILSLFGCCVITPILDAIGPAVTGMSQQEWMDAVWGPDE